jgi:glycosyltransferase involved in cell wall biosynthesis
MPAPRLTIVVPAPQLEPNLGVVLAFVAEHALDAEIACVDDGSTDGSGDLLPRLATAEPRLRTLSLAANPGKVAAVRRGMLDARGQDALFRAPCAPREREGRAAEPRPSG